MSVKTVGRVVIEQGEDFSKTFKLRTDGGYTAIGLASATAFTFAMRKTDGTWLLKSTADESSTVEILNSGTTGDVSLGLSQAETASLKRGRKQNIEMSYLDADSKKQVIILEGVLDVVEPKGITYSA
jgi:hypothetical protein